MEDVVDRSDGTILGIETSCDETAAAIVAGGYDVRANVIATQFHLHEEYGGVVPEIASRAHIERILPVIERALHDANLSGPQAIDAVAVGHQPGLIGSLIVGVAAARALAWAWNKPIIGVDHVLAHLHAGSLNREPPAFPALGLVVSGGHTSLCALHDALRVKVLGRTIDDAVGEAFDKAAIILGLGFPGGQLIDQRAQRGDDRAFEFPISTLDPDSLDFSYSGLKTSLLYQVRGKPIGRGKHAHFEHSAADLSDDDVNDLCASFQRAAIEAIMIKLRRAFEHLVSGGDGDIRTLIVGGGVSANSLLRRSVEAFAQERQLDLRIPPVEFCLDNAAMIAGLAGLRYAAGSFDDLTLAPSPAGIL